MRQRQKQLQKNAALPSTPPFTRRGTAAGAVASLLDYGDSQLSASPFRGFGNFFAVAMVLYLVSDPLANWLESGVAFETQLLFEMFRGVEKLMLGWGLCFAFGFSAFIVHRLRSCGRISTFCYRGWQCVSPLLVLGFATCSCLSQRWWIPPSGFQLTVALIAFMKTHSFLESLDQAHGARSLLFSNDGDFVGRFLQSVADSTTSSERQRQRTRRAAEPEKTPPISRSRQSCTERLALKALEAAAAEVPSGLSPQRQPKEILLKALRCPELNVTPSVALFTRFLVSPSLVWEPRGYDPKRKFRIGYFTRKSVELVMSIGCMYLISCQHVMPVIHRHGRRRWPVALLKLIMPMLCQYLLIFYALFECVCNLAAELSSYGGREFYSDWWNSTAWDEFARKWNQPVHKFLQRHVYFKLLDDFGLSQSASSAGTFLFSALLHELFVGVCFQTCRFYMAGLMMAQIPLIAMGHHVHKGKTIGNFVFWLGMALGLPLLGVLYSRHYISN